MKVENAEFQPIITSLHRIRKLCGYSALTHIGQSKAIGWIAPEGNVSMDWYIPDMLYAAKELLRKHKVPPVYYGVNIIHTDSTLETRFGINIHERNTISISRGDVASHEKHRQMESFEMQYQHGLNEVMPDDIKLLRSVVVSKAIDLSSHVSSLPFFGSQ